MKMLSTLYTCRKASGVLSACKSSSSSCSGWIEGGCHSRSRAAAPQPTKSFFHDDLFFGCGHEKPETQKTNVRAKGWKEAERYGRDMPQAGRVAAVAV